MSQGSRLLRNHGHTSSTVCAVERTAELWIWQRIVSPHIAGLANALGKQQRVVYVAENVMTEARQLQGWDVPTLKNAELRRVRSAQEARDLVEGAAEGSIHICQGMRANGVIGVAQGHLGRRNLDQWIVMEKVNDSGLVGAIRRTEYGRRIRLLREMAKGILAIGEGTTEWLVRRGWDEHQVYPFAYFLPLPRDETGETRTPGRYRILFVGQLIRRKRVDLVIEALRRLSELEVELTVVGGGPLEDALRRRVRGELEGRVSWLGRVPMEEVQGYMARADCLILPSSHDGWGVVVSEALMVGTPVICSDRCGAAAVVRCSGQGGVFKSGDVRDLTKRIEAEVSRGGQSDAGRRELKSWAECLGADAGATYLRRIVRHAAGDGRWPSPPWSRGRQRGPA